MSVAEEERAGQGSEARRPGSACPFTLLDAMILVAGTAVSATVARGFLGDFGRYQSRFWVIEGPWVLTASQVLLGWTLAVLGCQAWRRGRLGRRARYWPGTMACLAVFVAAAFNLLWFWTVGQARTSYARAFLAASLARPQSMAGAVAVAWSVQALTGRWRPARAWPDRVGRLIGWAWLGLYLVALAMIAR